MKRNSQKKRNIRRSSLKQKKKVQHGGEHTFTYDEIIGGTDEIKNQYFVELLSKIIQKPDQQVYDLLTLKESLTLGQFQNVLKTFFLTPREIGDPKRLTGNFIGYLGYRTENMKPVQSDSVAGFKKNTGITKISGLQMAILYGRYVLIEQLFYYKLPDGKNHTVITPDMYNSFYENIKDQDTTPNVVTSQSKVVANSNALHLVFTCGVNIKNTPFIQSASKIAKLRHFSKMYLIKQLFHKINENWYKVKPATSETPDSETSEPDYDDMKKNLLDMLNTLQNVIKYYKNTTAKEKLTNFITEYENVLKNTQEKPDTNIKNLYNVVVNNNNDFIKAITSKAFIDSLSRPNEGDTKSSSDDINNHYNEFFEQLKEDYEKIINYEKNTHNSKLDNSKLDNSEFLKEYENLKQENKFLPEIKENNDNYIDFVIYKQFIWNGTKSILLPNANNEIIKLNDTDYKLEYEGSLKTVILPGTNEINNKIISNKNIEESKKINIITLSSESEVSFHKQFIITPIEIPEKSTSSEIVPDTSVEGSQVKEGSQAITKVKKEESEEA